MNYPQIPDEAVYIFDVEAVLLGREHRTDDIDGTLCWCDPRIERYPNGDLVIHRDFGGSEH